MRDFKGMKRQRGRNRSGGGGSSGGGGGGGKQPQNANRAFDSNGPEGVKVRGNAQHVFEKYQQLARDASAAADRVLAENYLQHAEHYFRLLRAMQPTRPASEILGRDHFTSGFDIDFEDEGAQAQAAAADEAAAAAAEAAPPEVEGEAPQQPRWQGQDRPRDEQRPRDERPRDDRPRDERPRGDRFEGRPRDDRPRFEGEGRRDRWQGRDDRPRDDRPRDERPRDERPRDDRPRDERPRDDRPRDDRPRDPLAVIAPQAQPLIAEDRSQPPGPVLRDSDGGESHAPAFLQIRPEPRPEAGLSEDAVRPRRRRAPRDMDPSGTPEAEEA
jgi:Domain of unknown function (DUF4167)